MSDGEAAGNSGRIERFEDIRAWQRGRTLVSAIYAVTRAGGLARDYDLARQMQRSAVSIPANIAEGYERGMPGDFHRFLSIAKGSCAELRTHLYVAHDLHYVSDADFRRLLAQAEEVARLIGAMRASQQRRR
jgi:four helix bundle protein